MSEQDKSAEPPTIFGKISPNDCNISDDWDRVALFFDTDMYNFFETVLGKKSIKIKIDPSYHLTDEEHNDPDSEYNKAKGQFGYEGSWATYQNDPDFYHDKFYPDGSLKYEVII